MLDEAFAAKDWPAVIRVAEAIPAKDLKISDAKKQSVAYGNLGRLPEAEACIEQALSRWRENPWLLDRLGELRIAAGNYVGAADAFRAIKTDNMALAIRTANNLAMCEHLNGRPYAAWNAIHSSIMAEGMNPNLARFFRRTFARRIRTNSLFSAWTTNLYADPREIDRLSKIMADALSERRPFSLIRLGDGEGKFLAGKTDELVGAVWSSKGRYMTSIDELARLRQEFRQACHDADVLGLPREDMTSEFYRAAIMGLFPITRARMEIGRAAVTDCHCHYAFFANRVVERLLSEERFIGYVGGRDIRDFARRAFPLATVQWHQTPPQHGQGDMWDDPHYPTHFNCLRDEIKVPFRGAPFLIAAGLLGKIYAGWVKKQGGVAIDIGAIADKWSGVEGTRRFVVDHG